jgi:hypothetical protein
MLFIKCKIPRLAMALRDRLEASGKPCIQPNLESRNPTTSCQRIRDRISKGITKLPTPRLNYRLLVLRRARQQFIVLQLDHGTRSIIQTF